MNCDKSVSVCMITYNHGQFISQAIKGVLMQKCNFLLELVIGEDSSTDNTAAIIKDYAKKHPDIIKARLNSSNMGMTPNFIKTLKECSRKYIAFCEGDDYWTDPLKLQKQVDFLEENSDFGLVHTDYFKFHQNIQKYERDSVLKVRKVFEKSDYNELLKGNGIQTLTVCLQLDILKHYLKEISPENQNWLLEDYPIWLYFAINSKIKYIPEKMATYRLLEESATFSTSRDKEYIFLQSVFDVRFFFIKKYGCKNETKISVTKNYIILKTQSEVNIGFDKQDYKMIREALELKSENNITITLLDKIKLISTNNLILFQIVRLLLKLKRYLNSHSSRFIDPKFVKI